MSCWLLQRRSEAEGVVGRDAAALAAAPHPGRAHCRRRPHPAAEVSTPRGAGAGQVHLVPVTCNGHCGSQLLALRTLLNFPTRIHYVLS